MKWAEAMDSCGRKLNESERKDLTTIQTCEDFKRDIIQLEQSSAQAIPESSLLEKLGPTVQSIFDFIALLTASLSARLAPTALVWGLMSLLIRVRTYFNSRKGL